MAFNQAAMAAFADYAVANINGRYQDLAGRDLNVDDRYGYQCMDVWNWIRFRLGYATILPTPDAAAVWELNSQPGLDLWQHFDAITPEKPALPGDIGIMNRRFFGNGVGHIFMILRDLGSDIKVLELNGLGDGFEDDNGGQHGSPGRIHVWPKTHLYGYLRWIGTPPSSNGQSSIITPIPEEGQFMNLSYEDQVEMRDNLRTLVGLATTIEKSTTRYLDDKVSKIPGKVLETEFPKQGKDEKGNTFTTKTSVARELGWQDAGNIAIRNKVDEVKK